MYYISAFHVVGPTSHVFIFKNKYCATSLQSIQRRYSGKEGRFSASALQVSVQLESKMLNEEVLCFYYTF